MGHRAPCSTCSSTTRAATTTARNTPGDRRRSRSARRRRSYAEVKKVPARRTAPAAAPIVEVEVVRRHLVPAAHVLQPGVARDAARRWAPRSSFFGKVDALPRHAPDDEPGRRRARPRRASRRRPACSCPCTRSRARPRCTRGSCARSSPRRCERAQPRGFADPLDDDVPRRARPRRPHDGATAGIHRPESMRGRAGRARAGSRSTSSSACRSGSSRASARSSASAAGIAHGSTARSSPRSTPALPFPLTDDQERAIARDHRATSPRPAPMHRLLQGEVGSGKTVVALTALLIGGAGRLPGRVHGADRGARRAARPHGRARCSTG